MIKEPKKVKEPVKMLAGILLNDKVRLASNPILSINIAKTTLNINSPNIFMIVAIDTEINK